MDLVFVAPPAYVLSVLRSVLVIPYTSVAYSAAGSFAFLKNLAVLIPAALATLGLTALLLTLPNRFLLVAFCGLAPPAKSTPRSLIVDGAEVVIPWAAKSLLICLTTAMSDETMSPLSAATCSPASSGDIYYDIYYNIQ